MSNKIGITCIISVLVIIGTSITSIPVFAADNPYLGCPDCNATSNIQQIPPIAITVTTDKPVYDHNSQIMITGHVANPYPGQLVAMKITSPSGNVTLTTQLTLDNNGDFIAKISTAGKLWFENGQYTITVQQGANQAIANSAVFQLTGTQTGNSSTTHSNNSYLACPDCNSTNGIPSTTNPTITPKIPNWVKAVFGFYAQGNLSDDDLINALQFLIKQGIIKV